MLNLYCEAWPDELKEAQREAYRAYCKRRCLEAAIARINFSEFEETMAALEAAIAEARTCDFKVRKLYLKYCEVINRIEG